MSERNEHNDGNTQTAYFAGGCFWGLERYFQNVDGVTDTTVGYAQSTVESPTYEQVCAGGTDAAETVKVEFNPAQVSLRTLCSIHTAFFWLSYRDGMPSPFRSRNGKLCREPS